MRISSLIVTGGTFAAAGALCLVTAYFSAQVVESASKTAVLAELDADSLTWAEVDTNGLQVFLFGTAPDEAARFKALSAAGRVVDASRVLDQMLVEEPDAIAPPHFSVEILRNDAGISVIGLVPAATDRAALIEGFRGIAGADEVSDLLEAADFPPPEGWDSALRYAGTALRDLPRSKVSVEAGLVTIKAMTDSAEARARLETALIRRKPEDLRLALDISAPRPVITPFTLRFILDQDGARLDTCSADTEASRDRILRAATNAGLQGKAVCRLGLGVPSRRWADAVEIAIAKLAELGGGTLTFSNADILLVAPEGTNPAKFDRIVGELDVALPEVFSLTAELPKPPEAKPEGTPEFIATLSPEGGVQLRGQLASELARTTADSYAKARFGSDAVYTAARIVEGLPQDWSVRTLAGLEALSMLAHGAVTVTPDTITVTGKTGNIEASSLIATLLLEKLGERASFDVDVTYVEALDPIAGLPTPEECEAKIVEIIGTRKILFEPGSARLDRSAEKILDDLADMLKQCGEIPMEIGGHTDSQGREAMNEELSRDRAQAVLDALRVRRVPTGSYTAKGYGEAQPIADNGTEDGREANRRIEFKLLRPVPEEGQEGTGPVDAVPGTGPAATADPDAAQPGVTLPEGADRIRPKARPGSIGPDQDGADPATNDPAGDASPDEGDRG
ncbi:OmpA family protein [Maliponia aquimaris]|uniref:Outer membrane porin F n=1 Tax=Maliponia aquimaris TaxID=1673631 RepID=A0A238K7E6_9RHOB|nr:OmpA family protein [Maliponia aquimaris]SMX38364.1 Outer membrane porin F precursor [Maliponia aquimaris]